MKIKILNISFKMILAGIITLVLAYFLGIRYYTTAAAIAILSIQWAKRDFISIAARRLASGIVAIALSSLMFYFLGQTFVVFSVFLIIFILGSWIFAVPEGIVPSVVLVSHFFTVEKLTWEFIGEESSLLIIAVGVAFVINMLYPQSTIKNMKLNMLKVDGIVEEEVINLKKKLLGEVNTHTIETSKNELKSIMDEARMIDRDIILQNDHRYITYLYMRNMQLNVLSDIASSITYVTENHPYREIVANFIDKISKNISIKNRASVLKEELQELKAFFVTTELPKTRKEFEVRAILFQIIKDIEMFLDLKIDFHNKYPNFIEKDDDNEFIKST